MLNQPIAKKLSILDKVVDSINAKNKSEVINRIGRSDTLKEKLKKKFIETPSQVINEITGGGFPRGSFSVVVGEPDSGKTSILLETIGWNMKNDPNFTALWLESEGSITDTHIEMFNIDRERLVYLEHDRETHAEKAIDTIEAVLSTGAIDFAVINSLKALVPNKELMDSMEDMNIALQARMNAKMLRKFTSLVSTTSTAFVIVTHLTTDIGKMFGDPLIISGGKSLMYSSMLTVDFRKRTLQAADPVTKEEGMKIGVSIRKNHSVPDRNPYVKGDYYVVFGQGVEQYMSTIDNAIEKGILEQRGAFIRFPDETGEPLEKDGIKYQWQGKNNLREFLLENEDFMNQLVDMCAGRHISMTEEEVEKVQASENKIKESVEDEEKIAKAIDKASEKIKKSKK